MFRFSTRMRYINVAARQSCVPFTRSHHPGGHSKQNWTCMEAIHAVAATVLQRRRMKRAVRHESTLRNHAREMPSSTIFKTTPRSSTPPLTSINHYEDKRLDLVLLQACSLGINSSCLCPRTSELRMDVLVKYPRKQKRPPQHDSAPDNKRTHRIRMHF